MYYMLLFSILSASLNSILLKRVKLSGVRDTFLFNLSISVMWLFILFGINGFGVTLNTSVILWGTIYGITQAFFVLFKTLSMNNGSVSVTTLIGNSSLFISVFVSLFVWGEKISNVDYVGLIILLVSVILCTYCKSQEGYSKKWGIYTILFLIFASGVGIVFKAFGKSGNLDFCSDMMVVSSFVMIVSYVVMYSLSGAKKDGEKQNSKKMFFVYAILAGIFSCIYNRLNIYLSGVLDAVIFFPSFNGGVIFMSSVLSMVMLRETLLTKQIVGILLGIIAICIIGIF